MNRMIEKFRHQYVRDGTGVVMENLKMVTDFYYLSISYASRIGTLGTDR